MAKSARSNRKKKLGTVRREKTLQNTAWLKSADERRQEIADACLNAPKMRIVNYGRGGIILSDSHAPSTSGAAAATSEAEEQARGRAGSAGAASSGAAADVMDEGEGSGAGAKPRANRRGKGVKLRKAGKKVGVLNQRFHKKEKKSGRR